MQASHTESSALSAHRRSLEDRLMNLILQWSRIKFCIAMVLLSFGAAALKQQSTQDNGMLRNEPCLQGQWAWRWQASTLTALILGKGCGRWIRLTNYSLWYHSSQCRTEFDWQKTRIPGIAAVPPIHKNSFGFAKSKALLGLIGPVSRARVMDLWCDDLDRPPTPAQRVHSLSARHEHWSFHFQVIVDQSLFAQ